MSFLQQTWHDLGFCLIKARSVYGEETMAEARVLGWLKALELHYDRIQSPRSS